MRPSNLYIIGGEDRKWSDKVKDNSTLVFLDKVQSDFKNAFNLIGNFQEQQASLRKKWLQLQEEVFKKIQPCILADEDFKYLLSNIFFEGSPYKTGSIYLFFKLNIILDYIKKNNIKKVFLYNVSAEVAAFFGGNSAHLSLQVNEISSKKNVISVRNFVRCNPIASLIFRAFKELKKIRQRLPTRNFDLNKCVVCYYPGHTVSAEFESVYFAEVSNLLNKDYFWLFLYGGESSRLAREDNFLSNSVKNFNFLDAYFSWKDLCNLSLEFFSLRKKLKCIDLKQIFNFEEIDYFAIFKNDWNVSNSIVLLDALIIERKFEHLFHSQTNVKEVVYLLEFQPWESMLNKISEKYGVVTKAVVHSVVRPNSLNFIHPKLIHPFQYNPNLVGANGPFCRKILLDNGFHENEVLDVEAQRFIYLGGGKNIYNHFTLRRSILIVTSIDPVETSELLCVFSKIHFTFEKVYIKEHPRSPVKPFIDTATNNFPDYKLIMSPMSDALNCADIVLVANSSSALLESVMNGKITISLLSLSSLPMPATENAPFLYFAVDSKNLDDLLAQIFYYPTNSGVYDDKSSDLFINKELPLWKHFLKV